MISINATLLVQIINLLVLIFILNRIMYRPLRRLLAQRSASVSDGLDEAHQLRRALKGQEKQYRDLRLEGRSQVRQRLRALEEEAGVKARALLEETQQKAKARSKELTERISGELEQARSQLQPEAEKVARGMVERILGRGES